MRPPDILKVALGDRSYDIVVGENLLGEAAHYVAPLLKRPRVFIITDANVAPLHLKTLERSLSDAGIGCEALVLPAGEKTKCLAQLEALADDLLVRKLERSDTLIALGGGVIGDLVGFAAAVLLRGVSFVQIPTTLLAQVDSSVGGKTGINSKHGKNLIGSFHQPKLVLADGTSLATLPKRERLAGYAEIAKYGVLADAEFFAWLEDHALAVIDGEPSALRQAVLRSCEIKAEVVAEDEREAGRRALLNLGHTFGHAIEAEVGYGDELLHGEAVAMGMVMALDLSVQLGYCRARDAERLHRHLAAVGLPTGLEWLPGRTWSPNILIGHMSRDKKVEAGRIAFVLARKIGETFVDKNVDLTEVEHLLTTAIAA